MTKFKSHDFTEGHNSHSRLFKIHTLPHIYGPLQKPKNFYSALTQKEVSLITQLTGWPSPRLAPSSVWSWMLWESAEQLPHMCICHTFLPDPHPNLSKVTCKVELGEVPSNSRVLSTHFSSVACTSYSPSLGEPGERLCFHE